MHPSLILPSLLLSLPLLTFAIPTPQDNIGNTDSPGNASNASSVDSTGNAANASSVDSYDPNYDPPVSQESAEALLQDQVEQFQEVLEAYATYTPAPPTPEESAAEQELLEYWSTASFEDIPYPTATGDVYDLGLVPSGASDYYELPKTTDPCGPDVQDGTEFDTCTRDPDGTINDSGSSIVYYSDEPAYYGVSCVPMPGANATGSFDDAPTRTTKPINSTACNYKAFCESIDRSDPKNTPPTDQWIWNSWQEGCALGMWLPSDPKAADWPDPTRCEYGIFRTMSTYCGEGFNGSQVATVNVRQLQGGGNTGMQVNAGYPSYIIAPEVLSVLGPT